jgi:hypothetical protein
MNKSRFDVLCRTLSSLSTYPLYAFFLSTGKITQFARPCGRDLHLPWLWVRVMTTAMKKSAGRYLILPRRSYFAEAQL